MLDTLILFLKENFEKSNVEKYLQRTKSCLCFRRTTKSGFENVIVLQASNKGADQPAHLHSLISAFVIHLFEWVIYTLATCKFSVFKLVSKAQQAALSLT